MWNGEIATYGCARRHVARDDSPDTDLGLLANAGAVDDDRGRSDVGFVSNLYPAEDIDESANLDATPDLNVVGDIDEVVDDRLLAQRRFTTEQSASDADVGKEFDVRLQPHAAQLRDDTLATADNACVEAGNTEADPGMKNAVGLHNDAGSNRHMGTDPDPRADLDTMIRDPRGGVDHGRGIDPVGPTAKLGFTMRRHSCVKLCMRGVGGLSHSHSEADIEKVCYLGRRNDGCHPRIGVHFIGVFRRAQGDAQTVQGGRQFAGQCKVTVTKDCVPGRFGKLRKAMIHARPPAAASA